MGRRTRQANLKFLHKVFLGMFHQGRYSPDVPARVPVETSIRMGLLVR